MDRARLAQIAEAYGIELVIQFGSTALGTAPARSDLDLALWFSRPPESLLDVPELVVDLQSAFSRDDVDLVHLNHADPLLLQQVVDHGLLLSGAPRRWADVRLYAFKRYQDHRRFLQMEREYVERAIASARR